MAASVQSMMSVTVFVSTSTNTCSAPRPLWQNAAARGSAGGVLYLLQVRPMTALPEAVEWEPPAPGYWMRNFRLGEWLPEAMTPLFADWLLALIEGGLPARDAIHGGGCRPFLVRCDQRLVLHHPP